MKKKSVILSMLLCMVLMFPIQALAAPTDYPFTYDFKNEIYTASFEAKNSIALDLTSTTGGSIPPTGHFKVILQKCSTANSTVCQWTDDKVGYTKLSGTGSFYWYGFTEGRYRIKMTDTGGYTVTGYGVLRYW